MLPCPRRQENPVQITDPKEDHWREDQTCSYCGSLNPDKVMELLTAGVEVSPTDKNYKIYLSETRKAYFQHFSQEQQKKFIEMLNEKKIKLGYPGYFYVLPFFIKKT